MATRIGAVRAVPGETPAAPEAAVNGSIPYDPETEHDPLIRQHISEDPSTGEAVFQGTRYPVWAVVLNLLATDGDRARVQGLFRELPSGALQAAERFWELHADDVRDHLS
ncbi:MAG: hypothetical protein ACRDI2_17910 [Chloroflexota bacterium]